MAGVGPQCVQEGGQGQARGRRSGAETGSLSLSAGEAPVRTSMLSRPSASRFSKPRPLPWLKGPQDLSQPTCLSKPPPSSSPPPTSPRCPASSLPPPPLARLLDSPPPPGAFLLERPLSAVPSPAPAPPLLQGSALLLPHSPEPLLKYRLLMRPAPTGLLKAAPTPSPTCPAWFSPLTVLTGARVTLLFLPVHKPVAARL